MSLRRASASLSLILSACAAQQPAASAVTTPQAAVAPPAAPASPPIAPREVKPLVGLLPAMQDPVTSFAAASDGRYLYTLGGYRGEPHVYSREGQEAGLARLAADGSGAWEPLANMPRGLQGLAMVHHAGKLCRVGGTEARNEKGSPADLHSVNEAACFDLTKGSWSDLPPLPSGSSSHDAEVIGNTLYVAGGWTLTGKPSSGAFRNELWSLDLAASAPTWTAIPAPFQRRALGVAAASGKLVIVGGITPDGQVSRQVDVFDPAKRAFTRAPDFPEDAFGIAVESSGDSVVASARSGMVYRWKSGDDAWRPVRKLAFSRFFHQLVQGVPGELIALGGISGMHDLGRTTHVERLQLDAQGPRVVAWSLAYPGQAKNRQGVFVHDDFVYLFGGNNSLGQHDFAPSNFVDQTWRLHLPSLQFAERAPFPVRRQTMQTVSSEKQGVALGGFGHDGDKAISFADGFLFDFEREQWSPGPQLPESRTQFGLAEHQGELWVFGGLNYDPTRKGEEAFQHSTRLLHGKAEAGARWAEAEIALPAPRRAFAGALANNDYLMLGGMRGGFDLVDDCVRYDFTNQRFSPLTCPGPARLSGALVKAGDKLYLAGGSLKGSTPEEGLRSAQDMVEIDPQSGLSRRVIESLPFDTRHMHAVAFQDRVLLVSTHNDQGRIDLAIIDPGPTK